MMRQQLEDSGRGFALRETAERLKAARFVASQAKIPADAPASPPQSHRKTPRSPAAKTLQKCLEAGSAPPVPASAPTTRAEADARGWGIRSIFVYVSGDAYVDHPSFGSAIITRVLSPTATKVGFIALSPIGTTRKASRCSASRGWDSSCRRATWTPW